MSGICLVGDVIVDVTLQTPQTPLKMRLGGIIHSARALWAMDVKYSIGYFAPKYLVMHIEKFIKEFGNPTLIYLGEVETAPYVVLINEVKETGNQGYEFLLREDVRISYNSDNLKKLQSYSDVLLISGSYDVLKVLKSLNQGCAVSIDFANSHEDFNTIKASGTKFENFFISTSSDEFLNFYKKENFSIEKFFNRYEPYTNKIILKENRGGSRAYDFTKKRRLNISSQTQPITHSVGVGDVFDAVCVSKNLQFDLNESLIMASWIATEYALTTYPDDFKEMTAKILQTPIDDLIALKGVQLPWEDRKNINIYIAAPDFDFVDTSAIDLLCQNLEYHNFSPRRPIRENGQMCDGSTDVENMRFYLKDMELLSECDIVIAVLLYNDPGTLVEIGIAAERKLPVFLYDPKNQAKNCMLIHSTDLHSTDMDEIISAVFVSSSKIAKNGN